MQRPIFQKIYTQKKTETETAKVIKMEERKVEHARKQADKNRKEENVQKKVTEMGQFKSAGDIANYISKCTTKKAKIEGLKAQMQFFKEKYDFSKLQNHRKLLTVTGISPEKLQDDLNSILNFINTSQLQESGGILFHQQVLLQVLFI